jgi:Fe-S-cluster containining protein
MEKMDFNAEGLIQKAAGEARQNRKLIEELKKIRSSEVDDSINTLHDIYTEKINCLDCANCCKNISPAITDRDIEKMARYLRKKPSEITGKYLQIDRDGDYIFTSQPCPFLGKDNYCEIYPARPKACRDYPHTDRKKQQQILEITYRNISVCPIVYEIVSDLKREFS